MPPRDAQQAGGPPGACLLLERGRWRVWAPVRGAGPRDLAGDADLNFVL